MIRRKILPSSLGATAEEKGSQTGGVGGDTILCLSTSVDKPYGARNGGGERRRNGRAELHPKCSPRAALALHRCDTKCRAKGFKFFEIAAPLKQVWPNTINLCKTCYNERRLQQGEEQGGFKVEGTGRADVLSREVMGKRCMKQFVRRMWRRFTIKKAWARSVLADAESVRHDGTDGRWQHETPYKEELEQVRHSSRRAYHVGKSGDWVSSACGQVCR